MYNIVISIIESLYLIYMFLFFSKLVLILIHSHLDHELMLVKTVPFFTAMVTNMVQKFARLVNQSFFYLLLYY